MKVTQSIFREYDIRGIAGLKFEPELVAEYEKWYGKFPGLNITPAISEAIGKAFGSIIKRKGGKKVLVGYEYRPYAIELRDEFVKGILSTGINVDTADKTATPFIYYLTAKLDYDGGVNITGSHNIYFYNGFKMMGLNSTPIYGEELQQLYQIVVNDDFEVATTPGSLHTTEHAYEKYRDYVASNTKMKRPLKVVVDTGNGTPGMYIVDFLKTIGADVVKGLFLEPDAHFPNHVPDPEQPQNMVFLQKAVVEMKADVGVALDADGDRAGFVNEKGEMLSGDDILLLLARDVAKRLPGHQVLFDVKCSQLMEEMLPQFGMKPLMYRTGHAPIKDMLRKDTDIALGGEVSGHFYFVENYTRSDDGFYAIAQVLKILSEQDKSFSEFMKFIPQRVRTPEIKLPCKDEVKFVIVDKVREELLKKYKGNTIDGVRIQFTKNSWGLVRASNTSPYLTIRVEGISVEEVLHIKNELADVLDQFSEIEEKLNRKEVASPTGKLSSL